MAAPIVPQRPIRSQPTSASANIDIPRVPPRPRRSVERSVSPNRDSYARSPLNDPSFLPSHKNPGPSSLGKSFLPLTEVPDRPPSVNLPSIGQEGAEYAHLDQDTQSDESHKSDHDTAEQTKTVSGDLPLHAPKASLPISSAKARIATVTRTDSSSAAAAGIGKASSESGHAHSNLGLTITRSSSSQQSRPSSIYKSETPGEEPELGIPEIGMQIPLYPNAGDVQAPTPTGSSHPPPSTGIGFFNKGDQPTRNHNRTRSGREVFNGPPGSYGLHGHGVNQRDPFEKAWYQRHPDQLVREAQGEYGPAIQDHRKEYTLSSTELNKLVHEPHVEGSGIQGVGTPDERIGYMASEEYASRIASPRPASAAKRRSVQYAESPLRKTSFPASGSETPRFNVTDHDTAEDDDDDVIHVEEPKYNAPIDGATATPLESADDPEQEYRAPILAADEVAFRPEAQYLTPAVDIDQERRGNSFFGDVVSSRPNSRANSVHNLPTTLSRLTGPTDREASGTPLEDVQEYEPLFPDDEEKEKKAHQLRKQDSRDDKNQIPRHYFPSKDVWEDVPDSMLYETTVKTPQLPEDRRPEAEHEPKEVFDNPEAEAAFKAQQIADKKAALRKASLRPDLAQAKLKSFNHDITSEMPSRPGLQQRFPSQDIWEDTPSSLMHTTIITPESKQDAMAAKPPQIPSRPNRGAKEENTSPIDRRGPQIPDRPKPQIPARPTRTASGDSSEGLTLARSLSKEDDTSAPVPAKTKPPVPSRPAGSKIAALKAGFMSDLNSRLQLGPQAVPKPAEKEVEEEKEKAPLADARKGRAKGPARRKPGVSPAASGASESSKDTPKLSFATVVSIWEIDDNGHVSTVSSRATKSSNTTAAQSQTAPEKLLGTAAGLGTEPVAEKKTDDVSAQTDVSEKADKSIQTGQLDVEIQKTAGGPPEKTTIYLGGRASPPGTIVVKDGEEHVGSADGLGGIEKTSPA